MLLCVQPCSDNSAAMRVSAGGFCLVLVLAQYQIFDISSRIRYNIHSLKFPPPSAPTGKTAAFMLPVLERLLYRSKSNPTTRVLVMSPTRELAAQCYAVATKLAQFTDITFSLVVGMCKSGG